MKGADMNDYETSLSEAKKFLNGRTDLEVRKIVAGNHASMLDLARDLHVTVTMGSYGSPSGWVLALNGSPAKGMVFLENHVVYAVHWRWDRVRRLPGQKADVLYSYVETLPDCHQPGYYINGHKVAS